MFDKGDASREIEVVLKNKRKAMQGPVAGLTGDVGRKMLIIESTLNKMRKESLSSDELKSVRESVLNLKEFRGKLREMEDLDLITKLETIQTQDELNVLQEDLRNLAKKIELLSGALKIVSTKISGKEKRDATEILAKVTSLESEVDSIKKAHGGVWSQGYAKSIAGLEEKYDSLDADLRELVSTVKAELEEKDKQFRSVLSGSEGAIGKDEIRTIRTGVTSLKYVPVLKENFSKLYQEFKAMEKRIGEVEEDVRYTKDIRAIKHKVGGAVPLQDAGGQIKAVVESELSDVVDNVNALSADVKEQIKKAKLEQQNLFERLSKEQEDKIRQIESAVEKMRAKKDSSSSSSYEEFAEFRAKVLSEIGELKKDVKMFEDKVSSGDVESIVESKLVPHASNHDNLAKSVSLLNRKVEQKHLEISKNSHEKITSSVKSIMARIEQVEDDVLQLKDMRADIIGEVKGMIDDLRESRKEAPSRSQDVLMNYDRKFRELAEKVNAIQAGSGAVPGAISDVSGLEKTVQAVQRENDVLKKELEEVKTLYFEMSRDRQGAPLIIE